MAAAEGGAVDCVQLLLAAGADHAAEDDTSGRAVTHARNVGVLKALAGAGADLNFIDGTGEWPLKLAAGDGDLDRVNFLLSAGVAVDNTRTGSTALHTAAMRNQVAVVHRLLKAGARVNLLDVDGFTPLHEARSVEVAQALLEAGADLHLTGGIIRESALEHHATICTLLTI